MLENVTEWLVIAAHVSTIIAALAVFVTTRYVRQQVDLQTRDVQNDERRYMRESLSAVHDTLQDPGFRDARQAFFSGAHKRDYDALTDEERRHARRILSVYGLLGRMLKHGAVEETLLKDYWYSALVRDWERLENFVSGERLRTRNHQLFTRTEEIVSGWQRQSNG